MGEPKSSHRVEVGLGRRLWRKTWLEDGFRSPDLCLSCLVERTIPSVKLSVLRRHELEDKSKTQTETRVSAYPVLSEVANKTFWLAGGVHANTAKVQRIPSALPRNNDGNSRHHTTRISNLGIRE